MILGIGIDVCDVLRMQERLDTSGDDFVDVVFLPAEIDYCRGMHRPAEHFAARFAAKRAVLKALGAASEDAETPWQDVEILREGTGRPRAELRGRLRELADGLGADRIHVSLTHTADLAAAVAVATDGEDV